MDVIDWLLESDPAVRWQVLRDLTGAPPATVAGERARVATEGWGARLLAQRDGDGQWLAGRVSQPTFAVTSRQDSRGLRPCPP